MRQVQISILIASNPWNFHRPFFTTGQLYVKWHDKTQIITGKKARHLFMFWTVTPRKRHVSKKSLKLKHCPLVVVKGDPQVAIAREAL